MTCCQAAYSNAVFSALNQDSIYDDETRKQRFFYFVATLAAPIVFGFLVLNIQKLYYPGIGITIFLSLVLATTAVSLQFAVQKVWVYRAMLFSVMGSFTYGIWVGGAEGTMVLWLFMMPLLYLFYFGVKEGIAWSIATLVIAVGVLFYPDETAKELYKFDHIYRFVLLYCLTATLAFGLEQARDRYDQLLQEQRLEIMEDTRRLEQTLADIQLLKGLLPICSSCKNIRNEKNEWEDIAGYLSRHSSAKFRHEICADCAASVLRNDHDAEI